MNLVYMISLDVEPDCLHAELSKSGLDHDLELTIIADSRHGIHGTCLVWLWRFVFRVCGPLGHAGVLANGVMVVAIDNGFGTVCATCKIDNLFPN